MNIIDYDIMNSLFDEAYTTQRNISKKTGYSIGKVNQSITTLKQEDFLNPSNTLTSKAYTLAKSRKPSNAIILAAGLGMKMCPGNTLISKGLLEVHDEILIERQIRHLKEVGINDITIVVGFMKESYDYLIDKYGVELVVNTEYTSKNNLHSLSIVSEKISNTYILPADIWCKNNPFSKRELHSWFMVSDRMDERSYLRLNRKQDLVEIDSEENGNYLVGIAYITAEDSDHLISNLNYMDKKKKYAGSFWEDALIDNSRMFVWGKLIDDKDIIEINNYEDLMNLENDPNTLTKDQLSLISKILGTEEKNISNIKLLKQGPTNKTMHIEVENKEYAVRIPRMDVAQFIDRSKEKETYASLKNLSHVEHVVYFDEITGIKISEYLNNTRACDMNNLEQSKICLKFLKKIHSSHLHVSHIIDPFEQMEFYESLRKGKASLYKDYETTKRNVLNLKSFIQDNLQEFVLCHGEAVSDNYLISADGSIYLIDWEYAGMQDPDMDIALTLIYSGYDKKQSDEMIDAYYPEGITNQHRRKIYAFMAVCGLLWSNWCEYKTNQGIEFGNYAMKQYRYAKDFYHFATDKE